MHGIKQLLGSLLFIAILLICTSGARGQVAFQEVTSGAGFTHVGESWGLSWGDFNGDGFADLWMSNHSSKPSLYQNNGTGTFSNIIDLVWSDTVWDDTHGAQWIDYDNDGDQDLSEQVGNPNFTGHHMFINNAGILTNQAVALGIENTDTYGRTPLWFDYDNDGRLDAFLTAKISGNSVPSTLYRNTASGFSNVNGTTGLNITQTYYGAQLSDFNGDGVFDLIPTRYTYPDFVYDMSTIPFTEINSTLGIPTTYNVNDRVIADFNNDTLPDIFELTDTEYSEVVQINNTLVEMALRPESTEEHGITFSATGTTLSFKVYRHSYSDPYVFIGADGHQPSDLTEVGRYRNTFSIDMNDPLSNGIKNHVIGTDRGLYIGFNNDTQLWELLNVRRGGGVSLEISMESDGSISNVTPVGFVQTEAGINNKLLMNNGAGFDDKTAERGLNDHFFPQSVVAGDFDNDMDVDLYIVNSTRLTNPPNMLYENMGDGTFLPVTNAGGAAGSDAGRADCVATADYDNDGFLDLAVVNGNEFGIFSDDGPDQLFHNTGNGNNWIEIDLEGTLSNRDGIGAIVYATAGGVMQVREQNGGMHNRTQNHKRIHFGMGSNTVIDSLEVRWPSGIVQTLTDVNVNQILQVTEPNDSLNQGLLAYYAFETGSGAVAVDSSVNGNDGKINGGAAWIIAGANENGGGLNFNGTDAYVDIGNVDLTDAFTIAAWIKPSSLGSKSTILGKSFDAYQLFLSPSNNFVFQSNSSTQINYNAGLVVDTWYHVAVTFNTTEGIKLYVNGSVVNTNSSASIINTNNVVTKIGATTATPKNFFSGVIDEVRIYNRDLTAIEIQYLLNVGGSTPTPTPSPTPSPNANLLTYYAFETGSGTVVIDSSGNGNDGSINGGAVWTVGANGIGGGLDFNGVDAFVDIGDIDLTDAFTIAAWIKPSSLGIKSAILGKAFETYQLYLSPQNSFVFQSNSATQLNYNAGLVADTWHHVAVTFDMIDGMALYVDGVIVDVDGTTQILNTNNVVTKIGATGFTPKNFFSGTMDEVKIYDRVLGANEVQTLFHN